MKCPSCLADHKKSEGAICKSCGYEFVLDPKTSPYLSDYSVKKTIDRLSASGQYYFTFNQLYAALAKPAEKKSKTARFGYIILGVFGCVFSFFVLKGILHWSVALAAIAVIAGLIIRMLLKPSIVPHEKLFAALNTYKSHHPIPFLADGNRFRGDVPKERLKEELFQYAPERILIVQSDDMVDMLVLNRFHVENKTAVVGASKYPLHVFKACQRFLEKKPDIPIAIVHDVSREGIRLRDKLMADPSWNLGDKEVTDLGLSISDAEKMKKPMWIPATREVAAKGGGAGSKPAAEMVGDGMSVPLDTAAPKVMLGVMGMAAIGGLALMSTELLAQRQIAGATDSGGGFG